MKPVYRTFALLLMVFVAVVLPARIQAQDDSPVTGVDVFSVATQGEDPGPGSDVFNLNTSYLNIPGNSQPVPRPHTLDLGKLFGKTGNDPCRGRNTSWTARQWLESTTYPQAYYCAADGVTPGIHRKCSDLPQLPPSGCLRPPLPGVARLISGCKGPSRCMYDLRQEFCADVYRLWAELEAGAPWPPREEFYTPTSGLPRSSKSMLLILRTTLALMCQNWGFPHPTRKTVVPATGHANDQGCTTCDCSQSGDGPQAVSAYTRGFLQGFGSCLGGTFQAPISALMGDGRDFVAVGQALVNRDGATAAELLSIKGERNRSQFDQFIGSLNPNIYNVAPEEVGLRDGYRLCGFGVLPGVIQAVGVKMIPGRTQMLPKSGILLRRMLLQGASALVNRNNAATGVGLVFEEGVGGNLARGFTTIDGVPANELMSAVFHRGGLLENPSQIFSAKTLGATPGSYLAPGSVLSAVKRYLNTLNNYTSACKNGIRVVAGPNTSRVLKLGIPASATAQQLVQVDEAAMLARSMNIELQVYRLEGVEGW